MEKDQLKEVLAALDDNKYEVEIEGPDGITEHVSYVGETFIRINGDESLYGVDAGRCMVRTCGHEYECDLNSGCWTEDGDEIDDGTLIPALEGKAGVVCGKHADGAALRSLYARLNGLPQDMIFCWSEGEDLKDVSELGEGEVDVIVRYTVKDEGGWDELEASVDDGQLFQLYRQLKRSRRLPQGDGEIEVTSEEIEKYVPELYDNIIEQIEGEFSVYKEYHFTMPLSHDILDETLFGEVVV